MVFISLFFLLFYIFRFLIKIEVKMALDRCFHNSARCCSDKWLQRSWVAIAIGVGFTVAGFLITNPKKSH